MTSDTALPVELKPCPFCGNADVKFYENSYAAMCWVSCPTCGLEAPSETGVDKLAAVRYWNTRALSATRTAVKPLEWKGPGDEDVSYGDQGGFIYTVRPPNRTPGWRVWVTLKSFDGITASIGGLIVTVKAESREAAFAAAQADYDRRILSALSTTEGE